MTPNDETAGAAQQLEYVACEVAQLAAQHVRAASGRAVTAGTKTTATDVVTHTDVASERLIRAELTARCPGSEIVGEELDRRPGANNVGWIVDPIDGTVNFLYDLPVVSVSIAATIDDEVVAGAVADVHRGEVFSATINRGARRDGAAIETSSVTDFGLALVGTGFAYDARLRREQAEVLTTLLPACRDIRCMGSAALNLCWVGCGRTDAYLERNLKPYDYAAGLLIAAEGGAVTRHPSTTELDLTTACSPGIVEPFDHIALRTRLSTNTDGR